MMPPVFYDLSDRAKLRVRGADAARYLQGQLTNDVRRAAAGRPAIYACVLTAKGRLVADVFLRAEGPDSFLLDADPSLREVLAARLERYVIADDVTVEDVSDEFALFHWPPGAAVDLNPSLIPEAHLARLPADRFGGVGEDQFLPAGAVATNLKLTLRAAGYAEATPAEAETRRITAGVPRWGAELDGETLPPEAGLEARAIAYDKGCYVGQETVSRLKSIGHVNRHLRCLRALDPLPLTAGLRLHEPAGTGSPGREVGRVTSAAGDLALGYVRRGLDPAGTPLLAVNPAAPGAAPRSLEVAGPPYSPAAAAP